MSADEPLRTTVIGSYPQPEWLIDRVRLEHRLPPRVRATDLWRLPDEVLETAQDDATRLAILDMERAGIDVVTDGEIRRESYSNRFATALDGLDLDRPGVFVERSGDQNFVPRVVGPIRRSRPVEVRDVEFLRANTEKPVKVTLPGPFTMAQQAQDEHYGDRRNLALAYAEAVNEELHDLFAAGADFVQIDEPYIEARPAEARRYAVEAVNRALEGAPGPTVLHMCFGYGHFIKDKPGRYHALEELNETAADQIAIEAAQPRLDLTSLDAITDKTVILGVVSNGDLRPETPEQVADRIRHALERVPPERLVVAPDCGQKYLPRHVAFAKLRALVAGARVVREELGLAGAADGRR